MSAPLEVAFERARTRLIVRSALGGAVAALVLVALVLPSREKL